MRNFDMIKKTLVFAQDAVSLQKVIEGVNDENLIKCNKTRGILFASKYIESGLSGKYNFEESLSKCNKGLEILKIYVG